MLLKAGALSLALLLASRALGLLRESALAAAFGATGLADVAVLMLTFPDWVAGLVASGALAYVLVPAWAGQDPAAVQASQRRVARALLLAGGAAAVLLALLRGPAVAALAGGLPPALGPAALHGMLWSALAVPAALLAALWVTRLQHERDVVGMYAANLVVNAALIAAIVLVALAAPADGAAVGVLGAGLLAAMVLRLAWLGWRQRRAAPAHGAAGVPAALPGAAAWLWAALTAGLPLALPVVARSAASQGGEGALATFSYAWKLLELPLILAIQLVAVVAFPAIAAALKTQQGDAAAAPVRQAMALAWLLACAAAAALQLAAPWLAALLFGWGRMEAAALAQVAEWARAGSWGLLPQAVTAVALTVLATRHRLAPVAIAHALAIAVLLAAAAAGVQDGQRLMLWLNGAFAAVALLCTAALGRGAWRWMPWRAMSGGLAALVAAAVAAEVLRR